MQQNERLATLHTSIKIKSSVTTWHLRWCDQYFSDPIEVFEILILPLTSS